MDMHRLLEHMIEKEASDLYLTTAAPPAYRINGKLVTLAEETLVKDKVLSLAQEVVEPHKLEEFLKQRELNIAISKSGLGRFRLNFFMQRSQPAIVIRHIKHEIPKPESLDLPPILTELIMQKRGLILFAGATGTGKSTSMAALVDYRNEQEAGHIITIEDPIEFTYTHKKSLVNQREIGIDTDSYRIALENTLRQSPDVILIGEVRNPENMQHAIAFAETGHLCISTLHANNANQAIERIINFFPKSRRDEILLDLSLNLRAVVSQRLIPTESGRRVPAFEILIGTPMISELIRRGDITGLKETMINSENVGMQTFDSSLYHLFKANKISLNEALHNADSQNNLRLRINLDENTEHTGEFSFIEEDKRKL